MSFRTQLVKKAQIGDWVVKLKKITLVNADGKTPQSLPSYVRMNKSWYVGYVIAPKKDFLVELLKLEGNLESLGNNFKFHGGCTYFNDKFEDKVIFGCDYNHSSDYNKSYDADQVFAEIVNSAYNYKREIQGHVDLQVRF